MRSFSLLRTNVGLTTNVKVVVDSNYGLFLESINSSPKLQISKLKKFRFNKNNFFDELIPYFFRNVPAEVAFEIKNTESDSYTMNDNFSTQFDTLYYAGAENIIDNKDYTEEYEYFAPLYIFKGSLPKFFVVFRIDGPGIKSLDRTNFREEFLQKFKTVKVFDLTRKTELGQWLNHNFIENRNFPLNSLDIDFRNLEFTKWYGIDYTSGGYTSRSKFLENYLENENPIFDFEKYIFDGYSENKMIYPQILNLSFLFDDTPATGVGLRKWSINRYSGFYIDDMQEVDSITPYILSSLKTDVEILQDNILYSPTGDPFENGYRQDQNWVEVEGKFYRVERYEETKTNVLSKNTKSNTPPKNKEKIKTKANVKKVDTEVYTTVSSFKYKIVSDLNLAGKQNNLNKKVCYVNELNQIIRWYDQSNFEMNDWKKADVHLIEIDGTFHNLTKLDGVITINTDFAFDFVEYSKFSYWINNKDPKFYREIDLRITEVNPPKSFKIYKLKFSDIKDFDTQIVENNFSKYEYETVSEIIDLTPEPKMYVTDFRTGTFPLSFEQFKIKGGQITCIPVSSDYTANLETFRIDRERLTQLWSKNSVYCRFGYQNSISKSGVPYLLNNNTIHESFNRCADLYKSSPSMRFRNLDYFYTINSGSPNYFEHSLHIEKNSFYNINQGTSAETVRFLQDLTFRFELDKYLNTQTYSIGTSSATYSFDYFSYLFEIPKYIASGRLKYNHKSYSTFEKSDTTTPNSTLFNGLKFEIYEVDTIRADSNSIENLNVKVSNLFDDYKFSILLSKNNKYVDDKSKLVDVGYFGTFSHYQTNSVNLAYRTSNNATPSNVKVGDKVYVTFEPPYNDLSAWRDVTSVGQLSGGGYGFVTSATTSSSFTYSRSGIWEINFKWKKIKDWNLGQKFFTGDVIIWEDILYKVLQNYVVNEPNAEPWELTQYFGEYDDDIPFWKPTSYSINDWCYRQGDYWYRKNTPEATSVDFWSPKISYSDEDDIVFHKGRLYKNQSINNKAKIPREKSRSSDISESVNKEWTEVSKVQNWLAGEKISTKYADTKWQQVKLWSAESTYLQNDYVVYRDVLYLCLKQPAELNETPDSSSNWERKYSFVPDSDSLYSSTNNPILEINGDYYICEFNRGNTLNNGITIYINKKWKNVLINISINDNTLEFIQNHPRTRLYTENYSKLTAANFIRQINKIDSKFNFIDHTSYVVIEEDGTFKKYNLNIDIGKLPYFLSVQYPDQIEVDSRNNLYSATNQDLASINPSRTLVNGQVDNRNQIDFYSGIPIAYNINRSRDAKLRPTLNQIKFSVENIKTSNKANIKSKSISTPDSTTLYRYSGYYMPIFYEIELFKSTGEYDTESGNYIFDTDLTYFGTAKQMLISKRSRSGNTLKLRNFDGKKSIYPMLDEFGLTYVDHFIFRSSWDSKFHIEVKPINTSVVDPVPQNDSQPIILNRIIDQKTKS